VSFYLSQTGNLILPFIIKIYLNQNIKYITKQISVIKIVGNPIVNFIFLILCLNKYIPATVPIPPPK